MTRIYKASFRLKTIASIIYYIVLFIVVKIFAPDLFSWVEGFISNFTLGIAAPLFLLSLFLGALIVAYAAIIPLVFFEQNYEDESLEQL